MPEDLLAEDQLDPAKALIKMINALNEYPRGSMVRFHKWPGEESVRVDVLLYSNINPNFETRDGQGGMVLLEEGAGQDVYASKIQVLVDSVLKTMNGKEEIANELD